jgi:putative ABC transport system permease protein
MFHRSTPLAWKNLTASKKQMALACGGIGFAVVLMFMQTGFRNALLDSTVQVTELFDTDFYLLSRARNTLASEERIPRLLLERAAATAGVREVHPVYLERMFARIRVAGNRSRAIRVIGLPDSDELIADQHTAQQMRLLRQPRAALVDRRSKSFYGFEINDPERMAEQVIELAGQRIRLVGTTEIGTDFVHDGTLIVRADEIGHYFPARNPQGTPLDAVDLGMVRLSKGADPLAVQHALRQLAPEVLDVFSRDELVARERQFWGRATPIGMIFTIGTVMGWIVGMIICYQILHTDISYHLPEFATLKAMGYGNLFFMRVVLAQSIYLTLLGYLPGLLAAIALFSVLSEATGLVMLLTLPRALLVLVLTAVMCLMSGLLAVRRLWAADPASLF